MTLDLTPELVARLRSNDKTARRQLFEACYGKLAAIAQRYARTDNQAEQVLHVAFNSSCNKLLRQVQVANPAEFIEKEFVAATVAYLRSLRSEYYVASTVYASDTPAKSYDLFASYELIDFKNIDTNHLIRGLQLLVPSQRLIFNLHVIDGYSVEEAALLLESSTDTAKSNLEKARFNLQKNVEKCLNAAKYEQSV